MQGRGQGKNIGQFRSLFCLFSFFLQPNWVATIAPWFRLHLPSCSPGFESQAHHLRIFQFVLLKMYRENNENKQKEAGIGPFLKKKC